MKKWLWVILPLALLGGLVGLFLTVRLPGLGREDFIPMEKLAFERVELRHDEIFLSVVNDGTEPVSVQQVFVNDAYRAFAFSPSSPLRRLESGVVAIPYPWENGEPLTITLVTATGVTFVKEIEAAALSPRADAGTIGSLTLIGVLIGVIPVFLGILWLPFLRKLKEGWYKFLLALTLGLLLFLGIDSLLEAAEAAAVVPGSLHGASLVTLGVSFAFLSIYAVNSLGKKDASLSAPDRAPRPARLAFGIALGIGIHNLGEGLAVGGSFAAGNAALGSLLVVGFMLHNLTEGIAVVAPLAREKSRARYLALLGVIAGAPAILGAWIGGLAFSPVWAALFLSIGAGAIFQVFLEILLSMAKGNVRGLLTPRNVAGFMAGLALMYATALLVAV